LLPGKPLNAVTIDEGVSVRDFNENCPEATLPDEALYALRREWDGFLWRLLEGPSDFKEQRRFHR
jgi:hypothetical protein